jgi:hypothetical protein
MFGNANGAYGGDEALLHKRQPPSSGGIGVLVDRCYGSWTVIVVHTAAVGVPLPDGVDKTLGGYRWDLGQCL